jgi:pyrroline-5-carboxylate reductase
LTEEEKIMAPLDKSIGFIGAGNMAEAMINGLVTSSLCRPDRIWASDLREARLSQLEKQYGIHTTTDNRTVFQQSDILVLAVKPQHMDQVLEEIAKTLPGSLTGVKMIISIAAGIPIRKIEGHLYPPMDQDAKGLLPIVRVMPNTPALVRAGISGMTGNAYVKETDMQDARAVLEAVGEVILFEEKDLDAVTAMSGSGPAYVFYFIEAFTEVGTRLGLRPSHALRLTLETFKGAVKLLEETAEAPSSLRTKVTSRGGTTEAALAVMEKHDIKGRLMEAVEAAARRSKQLRELF